MHVTSVLSTWAGCTLQEEGGDTAGLQAIATRRGIFSAQYIQWFHAPFWISYRPFQFPAMPTASC